MLIFIFLIWENKEAGEVGVKSSREGEEGERERVGEAELEVEKEEEGEKEKEVPGGCIFICIKLGEGKNVLGKTKKLAGGRIGIEAEEEGKFACGRIGIAEEEEEEEEEAIEGLDDDVLAAEEEAEEEEDKASIISVW